MESFVLMLFITGKSPFSSSSVIAAHWHASAHSVGSSPWGSPCVSFVLLLFFLIYYVKSFLFRANRYNLFLYLGNMLTVGAFILLPCFVCLYAFTL